LRVIPRTRLPNFYILVFMVPAAMPELSLRIVAQARGHGRVTLKEMSLLTGASRNTLKKHSQAADGKWAIGNAGHRTRRGTG
jgi:hypothetical protein